MSSVNDVMSRAPQGARGLKFERVEDLHVRAGRAPQGARGLKLSLKTEQLKPDFVAPRKGRVD